MFLLLGTFLGERFTEFFTLFEDEALSMFALLNELLSDEEEDDDDDECWRPTV